MNDGLLSSFDSSLSSGTSLGTHTPAPTPTSPEHPGVSSRSSVVVYRPIETTKDQFKIRKETKRQRNSNCRRRNRTRLPFTFRLWPRTTKRGGVGPTGYTCTRQEPGSYRLGVRNGVLERERDVSVETVEERHSGVRYFDDSTFTV